MNSRLVYVKGNHVKTINPFDLDGRPEAWETIGETPDEKETSPRLVSTVYAALDMRAKALGALPFTVYSYRGDKVLDDSDEYKNKVGFMPLPYVTLSLAELSLATTGSAYFFKAINQAGITKKMRYWLASSVKPEFKGTDVVRFLRKADGKEIPFKPEEVYYTWLPDDLVEDGPPSLYPLKAALTAANALQYITLFVRDYMQRGAVKAMILALDGNPPPQEKERIESWFNTFMRGARNMTWRAFNMSKVTPTIIGEGVDALGDMTIRNEMKKDILEAFGIPASLFASDYSSREGNARIEDERHFYNNVVVPDARLLQYNMNEQVLHDMDMHIEFEPERLDLFQRDESPKITNIQTLIDIVLKGATPEALTAAIEISGLTVTEEQLAALTKPAPKPEPVLPDPVPDAPADDQLKMAMQKFQRKALRHVGKAVEFVDAAIPSDTIAAIREKLPNCKSTDEVRAVFAGEMRAEQSDDDVRAIVDSIRLGVDALKATSPSGLTLVINNPQSVDVK